MTHRILTVVLGMVAGGMIIGRAAAQTWLTFTEQTGSRIVTDAPTGISDPDEKDYAWGDVDQDGDIDLVVVRKQPWDTAGARRNILFMNEGIADGQPINGVLVNRTDLYATLSDVAGDQGFNTTTNDRDVKLADVNGDGWLDVITAVTLSDGQPKHISHPRIYINQGEDKKGPWMGFKHEDARIPQLAGINPGTGFPHAPRFNNVAVGDVNNDGWLDLYFADSDFGPAESLDINNRLLINDGSGFFIDGTAAIPAAAQVIGTGVTSGIGDLNMDGSADLIRHSVTNPTHGIHAIYNDPASPGSFGTVLSIYPPGAATDLSVGDLNNDGKPDLVVTDDNTDRYLINGDNNPDGFATFTTLTVTFQPQAGPDQGFGGESVIADLDRDGFDDVIVTDVDFTITGCFRRSNVYRNLGNVPNITLQAQSPAVIPVTQMTGVHDAAVFDINGDGWKDIVLGRCVGMRVWINIPACPANISDVGGDAVDVDDLLAVTNAWGATGGPADINQDGIVDVDDLLAVINAWGPCI